MFHAWPGSLSTSPTYFPQWKKTACCRQQRGTSQTKYSWSTNEQPLMDPSRFLQGQMSRDYEGALCNCTGNVTWPGTEATGDPGSYQYKQNAGSLTSTCTGLLQQQQQQCASPENVRTSKVGTVRITVCSQMSQHSTQKNQTKC